MKMTRTQMIALSIVALFALGSFAVAQQRPKEFFSNGVARRQRILKAVINPTAEQQESFTAVRQSFRPQLLAVHKRLRAAREALQVALINPETTEATIQPYIDDVAGAEAELTRLRTMRQLQINQILTPEQLVKIRFLRERVKTLNRNQWKQRRDLIKEFTEPNSK